MNGFLVQAMAVRYSIFSLPNTVALYLPNTNEYSAKPVLVATAVQLTNCLRLGEITLKLRSNGNFTSYDW